MDAASSSLTPLVWPGLTFSHPGELEIQAYRDHDEVQDVPQVPEERCSESREEDRHLDAEEDHREVREGLRSRWRRRSRRTEHERVASVVIRISGANRRQGRTLADFAIPSEAPKGAMCIRS